MVTLCDWRCVLYSHLQLYVLHVLLQDYFIHADGGAYAYPDECISAFHKRVRSLCLARRPPLTRCATDCAVLHPARLLCRLDTGLPATNDQRTLAPHAREISDHRTRPVRVRRRR